MQGITPSHWPFFWDPPKIAGEAKSIPAVPVALSIPTSANKMAFVVEAERLTST
jgi:hypothetical protein